MDATLAQELLLIAIDDAGRTRGGSTELDCGIAGAALSELSLAGRIGVVDGRVRVTTLHRPAIRRATPRSHASRARPRLASPTGGSTSCDTGSATGCWPGSSSGGVLRMELQDVLWLFSVRRYFAIDPRVTSVTRLRLEHVVVRGGHPDARTAALIALLHACGLTRRAFPELDRKQLKTRMGELGDGQWVGAAVRKAIDSLQSSG